MCKKSVFSYFAAILAFFFAAEAAFFAAAASALAFLSSALSVTTMIRLPSSKDKPAPQFMQSHCRNGSEQNIPEVSETEVSETHYGCFYAITVRACFIIACEALRHTKVYYRTSLNK